MPLDLTKEELQMVLATLAMRLAEEDIEGNGARLLRSAIAKMAEEYGYEPGYIEAHIVNQKMKRGRIQQ